MSTTTFDGRSYFEKVSSARTTASAAMPAAAAFHRESGVIRYVWRCSGDFSSSAKRASASRAASYRLLCVSSNKLRSLWIIKGFSGRYGRTDLQMQPDCDAPARTRFDTVVYTSAEPPTRVPY